MALKRMALMMLCLALAAGESQAQEPESFIKVEVKGVVKTGMMGFGGETTGATITAKGITWELDFANQRMRQAAERRNGQTVVVTGTLAARAGIETHHREIVTVTSLR